MKICKTHLETDTMLNKLKTMYNPNKNLLEAFIRIKYKYLIHHKLPTLFLNSNQTSD